MIINKPMHIIASPNTSINAPPLAIRMKIAPKLNNSNITNKIVNNIIITTPSFHKGTCKICEEKEKRVYITPHSICYLLSFLSLTRTNTPIKINAHPNKVIIMFTFLS